MQVAGSSPRAAISRSRRLRACSRARFYIDMADRQNAFVEADEALKLTPDDVDIRHLIARLAMSTGEQRPR